MWGGILDILKEKAAAGLDVRLIYDDMGSVAMLSTNYPKELAADFKETFKDCEKLEDRDVKAGFIKGLWQAILRLLAPLF